MTSLRSKAAFVFYRPRRLGRAGAGAALALGLLLSAPARALPPAAESGPCSLVDANPGMVAAVDEDFDLLLDDGRRAALSGLEFPPPAPASEDSGAGEEGRATGKDLRAAAYRRLAAWLVGRDVFIGAFAAATDRWGRAPVRVYASAGEEAQAPIVSVGAALLEEGLARFRPDPPAASCANAYRAAEERARETARGLWADPDARTIVAGDAVAALRRRKGMVVIEGKISSIGESRGTVYLNFGQKRIDNVSVVVLRRNLAILQASGIDPRTLVGRLVRVRGLVEAAFGPRIEISSPAEIEILEPAAP